MTLFVKMDEQEKKLVVSLLDSVLIFCISFPWIYRKEKWFYIMKCIKLIGW